MQLFFWPCMLASLILAIMAINLKKSNLLFISAILILPTSLYLAATPRFQIWGLVFPLLYVGAAILQKKKLTWLAVLLCLPNFLLIAWLGYSVLTQ